jgi:hypothetical protein
VRPFLLSVLVVLAAAGPTASATAVDGYTYHPALATAAKETLWRSASDDVPIKRSRVLGISVRCYRSKHAFEKTFETHFGTSARRVVAYYAGGRDVHLRMGTCLNAHAFFGGRRTVLTAGAFSILLHESLHRQGLRDERLTTCFANESVRWAALSIGLSNAKALRVRNLAFTYTRLYSPPSYRMGRPNCLALARRASWIDFT